MKILITGAYGLLGKKVANLFSVEKSFEVFAFVRNELLSNNIVNVQYYSVDLVDLAALQKVLDEIKPEVIIHCAANVNLIDCEKNSDYTQKLHVISTTVLSQSLGLKKFIYISTDSVFDGKKGGYLECDEVCPLNNYARTKWEGEMAALNNFEQTVIIRTNIYGLNSPLKNSLAEWAIQNLSSNILVNGFVDVIFNPVSTGQLSSFLKVIAVSEFNGIINVVSNEPLSKYEYLLKIARLLNKNEKLVNPASLLSYQSEIERPLNTSLDGNMLKRMFGIQFSIDEGLKELIEEFKENQYE